MPRLKRFDYDEESINHKDKNIMFTKKQKIAIGTVCGLLLALISFIIGRRTGESAQSVSPTISSHETNFLKLIRVVNDTEAHEFLKKQIDADKIRDHLKFITSFPHLAGTSGGQNLTDYVYDTWLYKQKLDFVQKVDYDVLLDYPNENQPNTIQIMSGSNVIKTFDLNEDIYDKDLDYTNIAKPFLAYAANGSVSSDEVYFANFCLEKDFRLLTLKGLNLTNKIVLCKYGNGFRGNKIEFAQMYNASGVILFDDPKRSANKDATNFIYPEGDFLPPSGTQRGTIKVRKGDPATPNYPANEYAYRKNDEATRLLPKIPAQVIGYQTAKELFDMIDFNSTNQTDFPDEWKGDLNTTYSFGGKLKDNNLLKLNVYNERKLEKIYNVIGMIRGEVEPDRYIIVGNHRDAWNFGALDPNSGTSVLLEVSRVLAELKNTTEWKPRRSILFVSWDAEEYGIIGSVEWIEEFQKKLSANAVAYINMDTVLKGNYSLRALSSPLVYDLIYNVTKSIQMSSNETVFDRWLKNDPDPNSPSQPLISPHIGASSDYMGFSQKIGIPCIEQTFIRKKKNPLFKDIEIGTYPLYHTSYETFHLVSQIMDPTFNTLKLITNVVSELARRLSDSLLLPFNCESYADRLNTELASFRNSSHRKDLDALDLVSDLDKLTKVIDLFTQTAHQFQQELKTLDTTKYDLIRMYNERLRNLEKAFIDPIVSLRRDGFGHMVFSPSVYNSYGGNTFTPIADAIFNYKTNKIESKKDILKEEIREIIAIVAHSINSASSILKDPLDFSRSF